MKRVKFFLVLTALFCASIAQSQLRFGIKGGVNMSDVSFDKEIFKSDYMTGFHIGPTVEFMFATIGVDAALLYSQKGFEAGGENFKNSYLEVPVNAKFKLGLPVVSPYFSAGPYVNFRIAGDDVWDLPGNVEGLKNQLDAKNFGAGLNFSVGADLLSMLQLSVTYSWELTDSYESFDVANVGSYTGKSKTWLISATYFF